MTENKNLYFLAILPDPVTSQRVADIKETLFDSYGLSYAQRLPAHITLQSPFLASSEKEVSMKEMLADLASTWKPFSLKICDYKHEAEKVLYLEVCQSKDLVKFQAEVLSHLENTVGIPITLLSLEFRPHITLAHRDLSSEVFNEIWPAYEKKKFDASFEVHHLVLFKHEAEEWSLLHATKLR